jgi:pimeloyl-ACP methyl ester carboxylesterase
LPPVESCAVPAPTLIPRTTTRTVGTIPLHGRFDTFDARRPLIFTIRGAFPDPTAMHRLPDVEPDADVILADMPGMHSPHLPEPGIGTFARAFDEILSAHFADRRILLLGLSLGGLVALAMAQAAAVVAVDPPLMAGPELWPMTERLRRALRETEDPHLAAWVWNLFGVSETALEPRDYRGVLSTRRPGVVVIAGEPLEPERQIRRLPGLIRAEDRSAFGDHPMRVIMAMGSGHNIVRDAPQALAAATRQGLEMLAAQTS